MEVKTRVGRVSGNNQCLGPCHPSFGLGLDLELETCRSCCEIRDFLQLSVNFLLKTINHFIMAHMPRNDRGTSVRSFYFTNRAF